MRQIFLDTVGLIALWDSSDQWHSSALIAIHQIITDRVETVTSDLILFECGNAAARKPYRGEVVSLRQDLIRAKGLVAATPIDIESAWNAYERREAAGAGVVDQLSFVIMRRMGITEAFTNDEHDRAAGFVTLF